MTIAQHVFQKTLSLSEDQQRQVLAFVQSLPAPESRARLASSYGILADTAANLDLREFEEARAELWRSFPREFPDEAS